MIEVRGVSKSFRLYRQPLDRVKERFSRRRYHHVHHALQDVSFHVPSGETLGIIGHNGAGKSTLLKLLSGVLLPDSGSIESSGRVTGLLELGTGFNHELTGVQNIVNNGLLIGMSRAEIAERKPSIIAFSELGDFIDDPMKTYSSGMIMRLAFSIAIHARPDTFLVDEALAVGDAHFQQKCYRAIREFRAGGGSILLVSHDLNAIKVLSDQVLLLDHGRVFEHGPPETVVNSYNFLVARQGNGDQAMSREASAGRDYGDRRAEITAIELRGEDSGAATVSSGEATRIRIAYRIHEPLQQLTVGVLLRDRFGQDIYGTNSFLLEEAPPCGVGEWAVEYCITLNLKPGKYSLSVALHADERHVDTCHHWRDLAGGVEVAGVRGSPFAGICSLPTTLHIHGDDS